jgi:hypothetical protein
MIRFYLLPIVIVVLPSGTEARGPKYFKGRFTEPSGIDCTWNMFDFGRVIPYALLFAHDITPADDAVVSANPDVYAFPTSLDEPVTDPTIDAFFETLHIPTNWLTPSTSYRELLRQTAGMVQFMQLYEGIAAADIGEPRDLFESVTLDDNLNAMSQQERSWFNQAVAHLGVPNIPGNPTLRTLLKRAGDVWAGKPFHIGRGVSF